MDKRPYHDWEEKHGLINNKAIDGFQYWNYMRRDMVKSFDDEYAEVEPAFIKEIKEQKSEGIFSKIKKAGDLFSPDGFDRAEKQDVLFICHTRRVDMDGKLVSIYTDPVADRFESSATLQWYLPAGDDKNRICSKNILFGDRVSAGSYLRRYFVKYFKSAEYKRVREKIYEDMKEPFRELKLNYPLHPKPKLFADRAAELCFFYKYKRPIYERLLDRISPKVIVEVVGGGFDTEIINEIARERGIPTIELQHGAGALEIWYPKNVTVKQFPQWYFTFGEFWKKATHPPIPEDHIIPVGFPYHEREMEAYRGSGEKKGETVIFLSGSKYGKEFFKVASDLKKRRPDINIIYKLHPREYPFREERYGRKEDTGIEIVDNNAVPLYELFSRCTSQVGVDSTAVYEGMSFGLKTYIWDIPKAVLTKDLTDLKYGALFKDGEELARIMDSGSSAVSDYDINDFFMEGSLDNIERGIRRILEGSGGMAV